MRCHAPSLIRAKNLARFNSIICAMDKRLHFNLVEPEVEFNLIRNSVFLCVFSIEDLTRFSVV